MGRAMKVLDLFSGIGGFSLGLERTGGFETTAFCEIEPFCQQVLRKHWPVVPIYDDVRELSRDRLDADGVGRIDVICGGFPCQDISVAGKGAGIEGERSGLWSEFARLIGDLRPRYAIVENVSALLGRGLARVLGDLAEIGYDAEWHCIPASYVGAPHRRDRLWVLAYPDCVRQLQPKRLIQDEWRRSCNGSQIVADANGARGHRDEEHKICARGHAPKLRAPIRKSNQWSSEPDVGRVANGIPQRVDRLKSLGNAVVPQIPEMIGRAILEAESMEAAA